MSIVKTYELIGRTSLATSVIADGKRVFVDFKGGIHSQNYTKGGKYSTTNKDVQKALEKDADFNIVWKLINTTTAPDEVKESEQVVLKEVPGVTSISEAKEYLLQNYPDLTPDQLKNKTLVLAKATELGLVFNEL